jgi:hypothetical protein
MGLDERKERGLDTLKVDGNEKLGGSKRIQ